MTFIFVYFREKILYDIEKRLDKIFPSFPQAEKWKIRLICRVLHSFHRVFHRSVENRGQKFPMCSFHKKMCFLRFFETFFRKYLDFFESWYIMNSVSYRNNGRSPFKRDGLLPCEEIRCKSGATVIAVIRNFRSVGMLARPYLCAIPGQAGESA